MPKARRTALRAGCMSLLAACGLTVAALPAHATEGGTNLYLLGSGGPGAAVLPPVRGIFLDNVFYYYRGSTGGERQILGGNVVADLKANIPANFASGLWVPSTDIAGGTLAVGGIVAFGEPKVKASAVLSGPLGRQVAVNVSDKALVLADPVGMATMSWKLAPKLNLAGSALVNVPVGQYRKDRLANLSFNRWILDTSMALTWRDPGWDLSTKAGLTFNGTNHYTDYESGTEFHLEASIERIFSKAFSAGVQYYHYQQISDDSGPGAFLGANRGRANGVGATAAYNFQVGKVPITARARVFDEFATRRRLEGTSYFLELSLPLAVKPPQT